MQVISVRNVAGIVLSQHQPPDAYAVECFTGFPDVPAETHLLQGARADSLHADPPQAFRQFQVFDTVHIRIPQVYHPELDIPWLDMDR